MSSTAVGDPFTAVPDHQLPRRPCRSRGRRETNRSPTTGHTAHTRNPGPPNWCPQRRLARRAERPAPVVRLRTCLICAASCRPGAVVRCWAICAHDLYRSRKCRLCARPSWSPRQMGARRGADLCGRPPVEGRIFWVHVPCDPASGGCGRNAAYVRVGQGATADDFRRSG